MADENTTLLRIEGDASGVKRAAVEARQAVAELNQTTTASTEQVGSATKQTADELGKQEEKVKAGAESFGDLAKRMGTSEHAARAFQQAIARVSPELAALMGIAMKAGDVFNFAFSKVGLVFVGITAGVTALSAAVTYLLGQIKEVEQAAAAAVAANEKLRGQTRTQERAAGEAAAKAGLGPEARPGIRATVDFLAEAGISAETAAQVAPALVDEKGGLAVDRELAIKEAAGVQIGAIEAPTGRGPKAVAAWQRKAKRIAESPREKESIENAAAQLLDLRRAELEGMARAPTTPEVQQFVETETGETGEEAQARAEKVKRQLREGPRAGFQISKGMAIDQPDPFRKWLLELGGAERVPVEEPDPLVAQIRERARQAEAESKGLGVPEGPALQPQKPPPPPPPETIGLEFEPRIPPIPMPAAAGVPQAGQSVPRATAGVSQGKAAVSEAAGKPVEMTHEVMNRQGEREKVPALPESGPVIVSEAEPARAKAGEAEPALPTGSAGGIGELARAIGQEVAQALRQQGRQAEPVASPVGAGARGQSAGSQPGMTVNNFGTMHLAPDDRFAKSPRMRAAG